MGTDIEPGLMFLALLGVPAALIVFIWVINQIYG